MARPLTVEPVDATFGAVVTGFRIAELDDDTWQALHAAWLEYALLIFPGQHLTREQQIAFAKRFGPLEFEMSAISNVKEDGTLRLEKDNDDRIKILKGNMGWHANSTYMPVQAKGAVFSRRGSADGRRPYRMGRHARSLRRARRATCARSFRPRRLPLAALQPVQARPRSRRKPTAPTVAMAFMTGRCRSGRWSRRTPRPAASRC